MSSCFSVGIVKNELGVRCCEGSKKTLLELNFGYSIHAGIRHELEGFNPVNSHAH